MHWVNTQPTDIISLHKNNKPLQQEDLVPTIKSLKATAYGDNWWAQLREDNNVDGANNIAS